MVAMVLLALSSRLQPGERLLLYSHGGTRVRSVTHIQDGFYFVAGESVDWMYLPFVPRQAGHRVWAWMSQPGS